MNQPSNATLASCREQALAAWQRGDLAAAEVAFRRLLECQPHDAEALQFLADRQWAAGNAAGAVELLQAAHRVEPQDAGVLHRLGELQMLAGAWPDAVDSLRKALQLAPGMFVAGLRLGVALERQGSRHAAMLAYLGAIDTAQAQGRWLSDDTTAPGLRDAVKHATRFVAAGRRELFDAVIEPLRQRYGRSELARVDQCLTIYLGEQAANLPDPRQRPKFLYFPGIPSRTFYPPERFPAHARLEAACDTIREELRAVLAHAADSLVPFLGAPSSAAVAAELLAASGPQEAAWDAFFFQRHGVRHDAHCLRCPRTSALLDALPLVRIREHAPETLYSVLRPGTHILPHRGVTNTRLVTHLPLIVPPDCALRVGGETHVWQEGRCVTFDDTFEHEAWNHSDRDRVVLILDSWNPDLSEAERAAVADLVAAIGDFNRASQLTAPPPTQA
ncbi:aspartyl/asparaginyl beta-hydroxylase domain-containing protein [Rhodanobacter spathiphylli]|uniref:Aspartyl/asparaginyl beta-hydroxylase n=1 Tax=Rhodanobacter spathiphylli B39 TaxID=1163407 RepID=I4VVL9_9GAMM|nr:aspartyl/asparaginyl beta-hydroxylase domain-containing protein [Rhodanobacter spathiphylli]EIL91260.1 aspartyl/asparaginyl beta-hydroxylase [Rhodanobacter spathiphylli B39]